jgi:hypothetical protein
MANADAANTFMGFSFPLFIRRDAAESDLRKQQYDTPGNEKTAFPDISRLCLAQWRVTGRF